MQIISQGINLSPAEELMIREHAERLETFFDRLVGCRVTVAVPNRRPQGEPLQYDVRIDLTVPGDELAIKRQPHDDLTTAIQDAFRAAGRRLQDYAARAPLPRGDREAPPRGRVARLFPWEGYGFLETDDGREIYFNRNSVLHDGFDRLEVGSQVRFAEEDGEKGPQASTVEITRHTGAGA
jgi:cold shock CspA family protein/ribosome-associated translation inhibitor RaiA